MLAAGGACASAGPAPGTVPGATPERPAGFSEPTLAPLESRVAPFSVFDSTGRAWDHPFLGGFNVPRPQLVDIDADGDLDLFVQEGAGRIIWFERVDGDAPRWQWRTDAFAGLDVGEWYRFADLDGDGDEDLLGESRFSQVRVWENRGPGAEPQFVTVADTLRDDTGRPIYADRQNIANVVDFDCDGRLDLMLGRLDGTVTRYEATAPWSGRGAPSFEFVTDRFEDISIVAQITPSLRHGANTLVFADADGDGDKDLFWGDFFEPGILILENTGTCDAPAFSNEPVSFPPANPLSTSGYNAPTFGDVDGDGDLDAVVGVLGGAYNAIETAADNLYLLIQGDDGWAVETRRLIGQIDVGAESVPAVGDLDGDGDLDVLLANKIDPRENRTARIYHYENTGTASAPELRDRGALPIEGAFHYAPTLGDLDGDGRADLLVGTWNEGILWFRSAGPGAAFAAEPDTLVHLSRGSHASPVLADLDGDGDLDLVAGESSGEVNLWRNDGTPREPRFVLVTDALAGFDAGRRSAPAAADLDGDGDLDLLIGSEDGRATVLWNVGGGVTADSFVAGEAGYDLPGISAPVWADLDGDGAPELLVGVRSGGLLYFARSTPHIPESP